MSIPAFVKSRIRKISVALNPLKSTARFWDHSDTRLVMEYWWNNPVFREFIQGDITGDGGLTWHSWKIGQRKSAFGRTLCFGDGYGMAAEARLRRSDLSEIVYLNISPGEGERFVHRMAELDIGIPCHFIQADANVFDFTSLGVFDTIIDTGAFHHFQDYERVFPRLNAVLRARGRMYVDEYVGPSKFCFDRCVIEIINDWLKDLPEELVANRKPVEEHEFLRMYRRGDDPSECLRSGELHRCLLENFQLIESTAFGGSILFPFFLTANLKPRRLIIDNWYHTEAGRRESARLVRLEKGLIESGKIQPSYRYYVFKKKESEKNS